MGEEKTKETKMQSCVTSFASPVIVTKSEWRKNYLLITKMVTRAMFQTRIVEGEGSRELMAFEYKPPSTRTTTTRVKKTKQSLQSKSRRCFYFNLDDPEIIVFNQPNTLTQNQGLMNLFIYFHFQVCLEISELTHLVTSWLLSFQIFTVTSLGCWSSFPSP